MNLDTPGTAASLCRLLMVGAGPLLLESDEHSKNAPGVANRLWNFVQPALHAGHECLVFSLEDESPALLKSLRLPDPVSRDYPGLRLVRIPVEDCRQKKILRDLVEKFDPGLVIGAGTLQASFSACTIAGDRPVWTDLFGDPLAEIQAKAEVSDSRVSINELLMVWQIMTRVLLRTDACSTVSRRQMDALSGQLLMTGRDGFVPSSVHQNNSGVNDMNGRMYFIPCSLESFDVHDTKASLGRAELFQSRGLPHDAQVAVCSGGFNAWMDVDTLVYGMELAMSDNPALHLVVTGGALPGYLSLVYESFRDRIGKSDHAGRFHDLGWLPHSRAMEWLQAAHVGLIVDRLCIETRLGSRNRLLYHAAVRCPTMASRGTEIVEDLESVGVLACFDSGDARQLASGLKGLLDHPDQATRLGEKLGCYCEEHYLFGKSAASFLQFAANPQRHEDTSSIAWESGSGEMNYSQWIAHYLDVPRRHEEWSELERFRGGCLARLAGLFKGRGSD
jgi:glycosyltransferase involved in cell wall biosynthesis